jgi:hypothetical protein
VQQASKRGASKGSWLEQMLAGKARMLVTVALANKMARIGTLNLFSRFLAAAQHAVVRGCPN